MEINVIYAPVKRPLDKGSARYQILDVSKNTL